MSCVSCLGIWWRHDSWISQKLKSDYLKNTKSFGSDIKCFLWDIQKPSSKNVADTTFKKHWGWVEKSVVYISVVSHYKRFLSKI